MKWFPRTPDVPKQNTKHQNNNSLFKPKINGNTEIPILNPAPDDLNSHGSVITIVTRLADAPIV